MSDANDDAKRVRVRLRRTADGEYSAVGIDGTLLACGQDFPELRQNLERAVRLRHGPTARPMLLLGTFTAIDENDENDDRWGPRL
jgi:hypothetical protein